MQEGKLCYAIYIFHCIYLLTCSICSRNNLVKLLYYIQLNKELNYKYLVYLQVLSSKLSLTNTQTQVGVIKIIKL